ncbi:MAG: hypothetical protein ABUS79_17000, partial [Pseudomonadota bacterium]
MGRWRIVRVVRVAVLLLGGAAAVSSCGSAQIQGDGNGGHAGGGTDASGGRANAGGRGGAAGVTSSGGSAAGG